VKRFADLIGHETVIYSLRRAVAEERVAHAYLFAGPDGVGKATAARALAAALLCREPRDGDACGCCRDCVQLAAGNHPDLHVLVPDGAAIKIDQVREMLRTAMMFPVQGRWQVHLVEDADLMNTQAANALLRTLEEPPAGVVFVLLSTRPYALPPTVISRCQDFFFTSLPVPLAAEVVAGETGMDGEQARLLAALSGGSPGRALEMAGDAQYLQRRGRMLALVRELPRLGAAEACRQAAALAEERGAADAFLELLFIWYRDLLIWRETSAAELLINVDCRSVITEQAALFTRRRLVRLLGEIERTRRLLRSNVNTRLALEVLFLHLAGAA